MSFPRYKLYKESGVEWLGEIPVHWSEVALARVLAESVTDGPHLTPTFIQEGVPFLSVDGIQDGDLVFEGCRYISQEDHIEFARKASPRKGDILMGKAASIGKIARVKTDMVFDIWSPLALIRSDGDACDSVFLEYALKSKESQAQIEIRANSNTQLNIGMKDIPKLRICLPSKAEQHTISAFLDRETAKIDALIAEQQRLIALLAEKRQATISHAVTKGLNPAAPMKDSGIEWLGEVPVHWTATRLRVMFKQEKRQDQLGKQVLSVYRDYGVILKDSRDDNMNKTPDDLSLYQLVNPGDLVVNKMKAWQGSLGISPLEGITSPDYVVFTPRHKESLAFLHLLLRSQRMVRIYRSISNGIRPAQWRLEPDSFLDLRVFLPPKQEQRELVSFVTDQTSRFDTLTTEAQRAIALLQERRTALISAAVTGKIDVRGALHLKQDSV